MKRMLMVLVILIAADAVYSGKTAADTVRAWNKLSLGTDNTYYFDYRGVFVADSGRVRKVYFSGLPSGFTGDSCMILKNGVPSLLAANSFRVMIGAATPQQISDSLVGVRSQINGKEPIIAAGTTLQYWRGDKSWQAHNVTSVTGLPDSLTNHRTLINGKEPAITGGLVSQFWSGLKTWVNLNVAAVAGLSDSLNTKAQKRHGLAIGRIPYANTDSTLRQTTMSYSSLKYGFNDNTPETIVDINTFGVGLPMLGLSLHNENNQVHYWYLGTNTKSVFEIGSDNGSFQWRNSRPLVTIDYLGSVGIKDTTPDAALDVAGSAIIDTNLTVGKTISADTAVVISSTPLRVAAFDAGKKLVSTTVTPTVLGYLDVASSVQGLLNAKAAKLHGVTVGKVPYANTDSTLIETDIRVSGSNHGFGGTPTQPLQAFGAGGLPATSGSTSTATFRVYGSGGTVLDFGTNNTTPWESWIQACDPANLSINYTLLLNRNGGRIAIGKTNPGARLDVGGSVIVDSNITVNRTASVDTLIVDWSTSDTGRVAKIGVGKKLLPMPMYQDPTSKALVMNPAISHSGGEITTQILLDNSSLDSGIGGGSVAQATDGIGMRSYGGWQATKENNISGNYEGRTDLKVRKNGFGLVTFIRAIGDRLLYLGRGLYDVIVIEQKNGGDIYLGNNDYYASEGHIYIRNNMVLFPGYADGRIAFTGDDVKIASGSKNLFFGNDWSNSDGSLRIMHRNGTGNAVVVHEDDTLEAANVSKTFGSAVSGACTLKTQVGVPLANSGFKIKTVGDLIVVQIEQMVVPYPGSAYQVLLVFPSGVLPECVFSGLSFSISLWVGGQRVAGTLTRYNNTDRSFYVWLNTGPWLPNTDEGLFTQSFYYISK